MGTALAISGKILGAVGAGFCLGVGFWASKQLTGRIDQFIFEHSDEFKRLKAEQRAQLAEQRDQQPPTPEQQQVVPAVVEATPVPV